jgi:hypothetical protein
LTPVLLRPILKLFSNVRLFLPRGIFPIDLLVKILKAHLPFIILTTCTAYYNILDLITLTI